MVDEMLRDSYVEAIEEKDDSHPFDAIPRQATVEMCYIPDYPDYLECGSLQDMWIVGYSSMLCLTVVLNQNLARFLRFVNVGSEELLAEIREYHDLDLRENPDPAQFPGGTESRHYAKARSLAETWQQFSVESDPTRPSLLTPRQVVTVLDNASYGDVPVFACLMSVRAFIEQDWSKPITFEGRALVGIHDFKNGSDYVEIVSGKFTLPANTTRNSVVANRKGYGFDSVYGIVPSFYRLAPSNRSDPGILIDAAAATADAEPETPGTLMPR